MTWIEGRRVVVTGATSGIGRGIALRLASMGAQVVLACRDRARAEEVAAGIDAATGEPRTAVMTVDTSDARSIQAFTDEFRRAYRSLDVLVNNAGVLMRNRRTSVDGVELTFATNVLGYHLVTAGLLAALEAAAPSRVVNVASTFAGHLDLEDLGFERRPYDGMAAYAQSKACDRMLTWALARRFPADRVAFNAMAPGLMLGTGLYRDVSSEVRHGLEQLESRTVGQGADTAVWLASARQLAGVTGRFFEERAEVPCQFRNHSHEETLLQACDRLSRPLQPLG